MDDRVLYDQTGNILDVNTVLVPLDKLRELQAEAARYRWLRDHICNALHLTRDGDHACNYTTAKEWIEEFCPDDFTDDDPAEVERMKATNTIWRLQVYPNTPIGFNVWHGATLDAAIDAALAHKEI